MFLHSERVQSLVANLRETRLSSAQYWRGETHASVVTGTLRSMRETQHPTAFSNEEVDTMFEYVCIEI